MMHNCKFRFEAACDWIEIKNPFSIFTILDANYYNTTR